MLHCVFKPPLTCNLEQLHLAQVRIDSPRFLHFIQPLHPRLASLHLNAVTGLFNTDLLLFLSAIAPTLEVLEVMDCAIPCQTDDEELAIDDVMPRLAALRRIE